MPVGIIGQSLIRGISGDMQLVVVVYIYDATIDIEGRLYFERRAEGLAIDGDAGGTFVFGGRLIEEVTFACGHMRGASAGSGFEEGGFMEHGFSACCGGFDFFPLGGLVGGSQCSLGEFG